MDRDLLYGCFISRYFGGYLVYVNEKIVIFWDNIYKVNNKGRPRVRAKARNSHLVI